MNIKEFLETLQEGKGANVRYVVIVNGERYATFDNEDDAIECENGFYNMDDDAEAYYGMFPTTKIVKEYVECYDLDEDLKESQSQEIANTVRRIDKAFDIDFDNLVYGENGFYYEVYPVYWNEHKKWMHPELEDAPITPESNKDNNPGDPLWNETIWDEFEEWCRGKGIVVNYVDKIKEYCDNNNIKFHFEKDDEDPRLLALCVDGNYDFKTLNELFKFINEKLSIGNSWDTSEDKFTLHLSSNSYSDLLKESKLTEAPDELGFETDDEIEAQMKAEMKKRKADRDAKKQAELDRQEQEKQKELARKQAMEKGKELYNKVKDLDFEGWFDILVPASGKADTVAGEIYRAFSRLDYRYFNDGDVFYEGYGRETCGSDAAYLMETTTEKIYKILEDMASSNDERYSKGLIKLGEEVKSYLLNNPELFGTINEQDSRKDFDLDDYIKESKDYEYQIWLGNYYWYDDDGNEIYLTDYINNGTIDIWKVIEVFQDFYFGSDIEYEVERPWTNQDDSINLSSMNKYSYEIIKDEAEDTHLFDDLIEELYNEYGDPNEEDDYEDDEDEEE